MGLKSKAKSNIGLFDFETTSELSIMKKWENNGIICKTSYTDSFHSCKISSVETLG